MRRPLCTLLFALALPALVLAPAGCSTTQQRPSNQSDSTAAMLQATATPSTTPTAQPSATPQPGPTRLILPSPAPYPTAHQTLAPVQAPKDLAGVLAALPPLLAAAGPDTGAWYGQLQRWGALEPRFLGRLADLDADGKDELILLLSSPGTGAKDAPLDHEDALVVLQEGPKGHALVASHAFPAARSFAVYAVADLIAAGRPQVGVTWEECGAHTCVSNIDVLLLGADGLRELVPAPLSMPSAQLSINDRDGDGRSEIILHGGTIGSVGAGPVQKRTEVYGWDGTQYVLRETLYDPSPVRLHVLQDADRALRRGDLADAVADYQRVLTDPQLTDDAFADPGQVRRGLQALARYRLITVYAAKGQADTAQRILDDLRRLEPDHPVTALAATFWQAWQSGHDMPAACAVARDYVTSHSEVLASLGTWGYGNPAYTVDDICFAN